MDEPDSMAVGQPEPEVEAPDPVDSGRYLKAFVYKVLEVFMKHVSFSLALIRAGTGLGPSL